MKQKFKIYLALFVALLNLKYPISETETKKQVKFNPFISTNTNRHPHPHTQTHQHVFIKLFCHEGSGHTFYFWGR